MSQDKEHLYKVDRWRWCSKYACSVHPHFPCRLSTSFPTQNNSSLEHFWFSFLRAGTWFCLLLYPQYLLNVPWLALISKALFPPCGLEITLPASSSCCECYMCDMYKATGHGSEQKQHCYQVAKTDVGQLKLFSSDSFLFSTSWCFLAAPSALRFLSLFPLSSLLFCPRTACPLSSSLPSSFLLLSYFHTGLNHSFPLYFRILFNSGRASAVSFLSWPDGVFGASRFCSLGVRLLLGRVGGRGNGEPCAHPHCLWLGNPTQGGSPNLELELFRFYVCG